MKIKKFCKILAILSTFAVLCGCADIDANDPGKSSTEQSTDNSTSSEIADPSDVSSDSSDETFSDIFRDLEPVDLGNGITLYGKMLDRSELEEYSVEPVVAEYTLLEQDEEFLDSLGIPELKELFIRSSYLKGVAISPASGAPYSSKIIGLSGNGEWPHIKGVNQNGEPFQYYVTGYTYESFMNEYYRTFTKETLDELFKKYDHYIEYDNELFYKLAGGGGWLGEVHREYELISKTDTAVEFKILTFHKDSEDKPAAEWNPELRNEYGIGITEFKFVLTEDGWRAANIPEEYEAGI